MELGEDRSHKRKRDEEQKKGADKGAHKSRFMAKRVSKPVSYHYYSEDDEDFAPLKLATDAPVLSACAQEKQRHDRPSGASGTRSSADITPLCLPGTKGLRCAGCGSSSHRLNLCLKASPSSGLMKGCPWCNTLEHSLTDCEKTKHRPDKELEMIQMRANMPSFQPTQVWTGIVRRAVGNHHKHPNGFPWTPEFTKKMYKVIDTFQRDLDSVGFNSRAGLPIDPHTKDWETIERNFPDFLSRTANGVWAATD